MSDKKESEKVYILGVQLSLKKISDFLKIPLKDVPKEIREKKKYLTMRSMAIEATNHLEALFGKYDPKYGVEVGTTCPETKAKVN